MMGQTVQGHLEWVSVATRGKVDAAALELVGRQPHPSQEWSEHCRRVQRHGPRWGWAPSRLQRAERFAHEAAVRLPGLQGKARWLFGYLRQTPLDGCPCLAEVGLQLEQPFPQAQWRHWPMPPAEKAHCRLTGKSFRFGSCVVDAESLQVMLHCPQAQQQFAAVGPAVVGHYSPGPLASPLGCQWARRQTHHCWANPHWVGRMQMSSTKETWLGWSWRKRTTLHTNLLFWGQTADRADETSQQRMPQNRHFRYPLSGLQLMMTLPSAEGGHSTGLALASWMHCRHVLVPVSGLPQWPLEVQYWQIRVVRSWRMAGVVVLSLCRHAWRGSSVGGVPWGASEWVGTGRGRWGRWRKTHPQEQPYPVAGGKRWGMPEQMRRLAVETRPCQWGHERVVVAWEVPQARSHHGDWGGLVHWGENSLGFLK